MNIYNCELQLTNMSEWLQHISNIFLSDIEKSEEILADICSFDFKFDTILQ